MRAHVRARTYPGKMNVVSAAIPGTDPNAGELILVAHAFETIATPGANDNCTGVATILEVGRALARLIRDGDAAEAGAHHPLPLGARRSPARRAYMFKHPELQDKLLVALNFDMTGANPKTTDIVPPDEDDAGLAAELPERPDRQPAAVRRPDRTSGRSRAQNAQFNYRLSPWPPSPRAAITPCSTTAASRPCSSTTGPTTSTTAARTGSSTSIRPS